MSIRSWDNTPTVDAQRVRIVTVDPETRRVEGVWKDGAIIQIVVRDTGALFRWPVEGETWTIKRTGIEWLLDSYVDDATDDFAIENLDPGDAKIAADVIYDRSGRSVVALTGSDTTSGVLQFIDGEWTLVNGLDNWVGDIHGSHIIVGTMNADRIVTHSLTADQIAAETITANEIHALTITANEIAANAITAIKIDAQAVTTDKLDVGSVTASKIGANQIKSTHIDALQIKTEHLDAAVVTAEKMSVVTLSSITNNMGLITAGTITGGTIRTATTGSRVQMDATGLHGYALDGVTKVFDIDVGTGIASFTGIANIDPLSVIPGATISSNSLPGDRIVTGTVDTLQLHAGAVTANTIATGAVQAQHISVSWGGKNLLPNASFEAPLGTSGTPSLTTFQATLNGRVNPGGSTPYPHGTWAVKATMTVASATGQIICNTNRVPVTVGKKYMYSAYVYHEAASNRNMNVGPLFYNAAGGFVSQSGTQVSVPPFTWVRVSSPATVPATVTTSGWRVNLDNVANGEIFYVDAVQLEEGEILTGFAPQPAEILPGSVGNTQITPDAITSDKILAGEVKAANIGAGEVTATKISSINLSVIQAVVGSLSAITANIGTITSGSITGTTIRTAATGNARLEMNSADLRGKTSANADTFVLDSTGLLLNTTNGSVRTANSGARVKMDNTGFASYASDGVTKLVDIPSSGSPTFKGTISGSAFYAPDNVQNPRIELDQDGLRSYLADGSVGARIMTNMPRPFLFTGIGGGFPGQITNVTVASGSWVRLNGGSTTSPNPYVLSTGGTLLNFPNSGAYLLTVPPGMTIMGHIGTQFATTGAANGLIAVQAMSVNSAGAAFGLGINGPATTAYMINPDELNVIVPFLYNNNTGSDVQLALSAKAASNVSNVVFVGGSGWVQGHFV